MLLLCFCAGERTGSLDSKEAEEKKERQREKAAEGERIRKREVRAERVAGRASSSSPKTTLFSKIFFDVDGR